MTRAGLELARAEALVGHALELAEANGHVPEREAVRELREWAQVRMARGEDEHVAWATKRLRVRLGLEPSPRPVLLSAVLARVAGEASSARERA